MVFRKQIEKRNAIVKTEFFKKNIESVRECTKSLGNEEDIHSTSEHLQGKTRDRYKGRLKGKKKNKKKTGRSSKKKM